MIRSRSLLPAAVAVLALVVACAPTPEPGPPDPTGVQVPTSADSSSAGVTPPGESSGTGSAGTGSSGPATPSESVTGSTAPTADAGLLAAVRLAETETGGRAYAVDEEDGGWEIELMVGQDPVELRTDAAGSRIVRAAAPADADDEDRDGLAAATIGLVDGIERAVAAYDGSGRVDGVELEREGGGFRWSVSFDGPDDMDLDVDVVDGRVLVDR